MDKEPFLITVRDLEIARPFGSDGLRRRIRVSVKSIVLGYSGAENDRFDTDEVIDIIRARSESAPETDELLAREIRDEVLGLKGVVSAMVSIKDIDKHDDAEFVAVSTIPEPKHAVLYGILP